LDASVIDKDVLDTSDIAAKTNKGRPRKSVGQIADVTPGTSAANEMASGQQCKNESQPQKSQTPVEDLLDDSPQHKSESRKYRRIRPKKDPLEIVSKPIPTKSVSSTVDMRSVIVTTIVEPDDIATLLDSLIEEDALAQEEVPAKKRRGRPRKSEVQQNYLQDNSLTSRPSDAGDGLDSSLEVTGNNDFQTSLDVSGSETSAMERSDNVSVSEKRSRKRKYDPEFDYSESADENDTSDVEFRLNYTQKKRIRKMPTKSSPNAVQAGISPGEGTSQMVVKRRGRPRKSVASVHVSGEVAKTDVNDVSANLSIQQEENTTSTSFNVPTIDKTELETRYDNIAIIWSFTKK
jgi:hypothetical protein